MYYGTPRSRYARRTTTSRATRRLGSRRALKLVLPTISSSRCRPTILLVCITWTIIRSLNHIIMILQIIYICLLMCYMLPSHRFVAFIQSLSIAHLKKPVGHVNSGQFSSSKLFKQSLFPLHTKALSNNKQAIIG